ncbi:MAG: MCE family protein [Planctomycetes bacterium]|nr:MCE family protein [Planctomycetota bacterium]
MTPSQHAKLGAFVVFGLGTGLAALIWLGATNLRTEKHDFVTYVDEAVTGLEVGSPVRFRGVTLGSVSRITVAPNQRLIEVHAEIPVENIDRLFSRQGLHRTAGKFVPDDIRVQLVSSALTGVKFLQVDVFPDPESYPELKLGFPPPANYIPSVPSTLKDLSDSLSETFHRLPKLADRLSSLASRIETVLVDVDAPGLSNRVQALLGTAETKLEAVDTEAFVADVEALMREARETLASTRALLDEVRDPEGQTMQLVARLGRLSESIERAVEALQVEETGRELRKTAQAFSGVAAETAGLGGELQSSLRALREAALAVNELAETLKRDPGALLHGRQRAAGPPGD